MYSLLVQFITGHNYANRHQFIIDNKKYPTDEANPEVRAASLCSLCGEGEESSFHILTDCEALQVLREKHFGIVVEPPYISFKVSQLVSFLREQPIDSLNFFVEVD